MTGDPTLVETSVLIQSLKRDLDQMPWTVLVAEARVTIAELERRLASSPGHDAR